VTDWSTVSSLATAGGTLVLAVATFSSVRSANRSARTTERALQIGLRPVLFPSRPQAPTQILRWGDDHWAKLPGAGAVLQDTNDVIYLAMSLRNVGSGIAVLRGWQIGPDAPTIDHNADLATMNAMMAFSAQVMTPPDDGEFRPQTVDLYVPPGDDGWWLAAIRDPEHPDRARTLANVAAGQPVTIDLLYGDQEGGQRTISRFIVNQNPAKEHEWICTVVRHWYLDRQDPRP
jgi:hypothetical protein